MGLGYFMPQQQKSMVEYPYDSTSIRSLIIMGLLYASAVKIHGHTFLLLLVYHMHF